MKKCKNKKKSKKCTCVKLNRYSILASPTCPLHHPMTRLGAVNDN